MRFDSSFHYLSWIFWDFFWLFVGQCLEAWTHYKYFTGYFLVDFNGKHQAFFTKNHRNHRVRSSTQRPKNLLIFVIHFGVRLCILQDPFLRFMDVKSATEGKIVQKSKTIMALGNIVLLGPAQDELLVTAILILF